MRRTSEQRAFFTTLSTLMEAAGLSRARIVADVDGFPVVPGRLGRIEWLGTEAGGPYQGERHLYVYTDRARMVAKLAAVPGVHRWQTGDTEARLCFRADDVECLRAVARLIRVRVRREASTGRTGEAMAAIRPDHGAAVTS